MACLKKMLICIPPNSYVIKFRELRSEKLVAFRTALRIVASACVIITRHCLFFFVIMWSDSDGEKELKPNEIQPGRYSSGSEIVVMEEGAMAAADNLPTISQLNVSQKSKVHIGTKITSVTQNVHNAEMVKSKFKSFSYLDNLACTYS